MVSTLHVNYVEGHNLTKCALLFILDIIPSLFMSLKCTVAYAEGDIETVLCTVHPCYLCVCQGHFQLEKYCTVKYNLEVAVLLVTILDKCSCYMLVLFGWG